HLPAGTAGYTVYLAGGTVFRARAGAGAQPADAGSLKQRAPTGDGAQRHALYQRADHGEHHQPYFGAQPAANSERDRGCSELLNQHALPETEPPGDTTFSDPLLLHSRAYRD